jgi:hypothetical protein
MVEQQMPIRAIIYTALLELSPSDFLMFLKLKISVTGSYFESPKGILSSVTPVQKRLSESYLNRIYRHYRNFGTHIYEVGR